MISLNEFLTSETVAWVLTITAAILVYLAFAESSPLRKHKK